VTKLPYPIQNKRSNEKWEEEKIDSESFWQLVENFNVILGKPIQDREKAFHLLERAEWNKKKVVENLKKNRAYYRRFFGLETKEEQDAQAKLQEELKEKQEIKTNHSPEETQKTSSE